MRSYPVDCTIKVFTTCKSLDYFRPLPFEFLLTPDINIFSSAAETHYSFAPFYASRRELNIIRWTAFQCAVFQILQIIYCFFVFGGGPQNGENYRSIFLRSAGHRNQVVWLHFRGAQLVVRFGLHSDAVLLRRFGERNEDWA